MGICGRDGVKYVAAVVVIAVVKRLCVRRAPLLEVIHRICIRTHGSDYVGGVDARRGAVVRNRVRCVGVGLRVWPRLGLSWPIWVIVLHALCFDLRSLRCDWGGI